MQITWRNIDAPDFSQAAGILQQGSNNIQGALSNLGGLAQGQVDKDVAANTAQLQEQIRQGVTDQDSYNNFDLNQQAQQYGGNVDQQAALDMLLGLRPSFQQQSQFDQTRADQTQQAEFARADKAAQEDAANKARIAAANITAEATANKDQYSRQVGLLDRDAKTKKEAIDLQYNKAIKDNKLTNIDEGLVGDPKIQNESQLFNKWRDLMKDVENPTFGSFFGGKGGAGFAVNDFNQELQEQITEANSALGTTVSPQFVDYAISLLDRDEGGAIKLADLAKVLKSNHQRYQTNEAKRKLKTGFDNTRQEARINLDNQVNQNIAKLLGRGK